MVPLSLVSSDSNCNFVSSDSNPLCKLVGKHASVQNYYICFTMLPYKATDWLICVTYIMKYSYLSCGILCFEHCCLCIFVSLFTLFLFQFLLHKHVVVFLVDNPGNIA